MKVVLFCGGLGTRIREYSENIPKPMIPGIASQSYGTSCNITAFMGTATSCFA